MSRRILITNDDGILAPGLRWLALAAVNAGFDVVVAAPNYEASGSSAALTAVYRDRRLAVTPANLGDDLKVEAYGVQASPGYIVLLGAIGTFGPRPDLVLSGINRGANAGHAVIHSGTVGAALTATNHGIPAMAVSLDVPAEESARASTAGSLAEYFLTADDGSLHWSTASALAGRLLSTVDRLPAGTILNVNVPNRAIADLGGVRQASLAPFGQVQMSVADAGEGYVRTAVEPAADRLQPGTDRALLEQGFATVTPVSLVRAIDLDLDL
jgi:5'-nucleotidase